MNASEPPRPARPLRVWYLTTGEAGMRQQAGGLARELSPSAEARVVSVRRLWSMIPAQLFSLTLAGVFEVEGRLEPPWPDILISCGRRSALAAVALRRRSARRMVSVHIQPPPVARAFDLVVAMAHDRVAGPSIAVVDTALHGMRAADLAEARRRGDPRFANLPRPWTAVLLGGSTGRGGFTGRDVAGLISELDALRQRSGGSLLITPSRRTPDAAIAALGWRYSADAATFLWDGAGANPYLTILAAADQLVVTSDSISMISEALATRARVWIHCVRGGRRHEQFLASLLDRRLVARLGEPPPPDRVEGIDDAPRIAARVLDLWRRKLAPPPVDGAAPMRSAHNRDRAEPPETPATEDR